MRFEKGELCVAIAMVSEFARHDYEAHMPLHATAVTTFAHLCWAQENTAHYVHADVCFF